MKLVLQHITDYQIISPNSSNSTHASTNDWHVNILAPESFVLFRSTEYAEEKVSWKDSFIK